MATELSPELATWLHYELMETRKYAAEMLQLEAAARRRERQFWLVVIGALSAGAALFAAAVTFVKLVLR